MALRWSVKRSLRAYVAGSGGSVEVDGGAVQDDDVFVFPEDAAEPGHHRGAVRFLAHDGMLDWRIADPALESEATLLTVARRDGSRIVFATLSEGLPRLTVEGSMLLEGFYPAGTVFDPIDARAE